MISEFDVMPDKTRVALFKFSSANVMVNEFELNTYVDCLVSTVITSIIISIRVVLVLVLFFTFVVLFLVIADVFVIFPAA